MADFAYRIAPMHFTDVGSMESWLQDMAAKGLVLGQEGIFSGLCAFEKTTPKNYRYRLIANTFPYGWTGGRFNRYAPIPDEKTLEFYREFGWEYVATRKDFNIYVAKDPSAPEMDTDPQVQATAIHAAAKRKLWDIFWTSLTVLTLAGITIFDIWEYLTGVGASIYIGNLFILPLWLMHTIRYSYAFVRLKEIEGRLSQGIHLPHRSDYRKNAPVYLASRLIEPLTFILVFSMIFCIDPRWDAPEERFDLYDYTDSLPFATMAELLPEAELWEDSTWHNTLTHRTTPLSETWELSQKLHIRLADGTETSGSLYVLWIDTGSPNSALFRAEGDYRRSAGKNQETEELNIEGADFAYFCRSSAYERIVMCVDEVYISADFHIYKGDPVTPRQIAEAMVHSIENSDGSD